MPYANEPTPLTPWPKDWPWYKQICYGSWESRCDMLVGPCACGAWHQKGEFQFLDGQLTRYGEKVPTYDPRALSNC